MTTFTIPAYAATFSDSPLPTSLAPTTIDVFVNDGVVSFDYTLNGDDDGFLPGADLNVDFIAGQAGGKTFNSFNSGNGVSANVGQIEWSNGSAVNTSFVMNLYDADTGVNYIFQIGGDLLPEFADVNDYNSFAIAQVTGIGGAGAGSGFEAGATISVPFSNWTSSDEDDVVGTLNADSIETGAGDDFVEAGTGDDTVDGGIGRDVIYGQAGEDEIYGDGGADYLIGGGDNDLVYGGNGNDRINGGSGADEVYGEIGNDKIYGNGGADTLSGGDNDDQLIGGGGNDFLNGDAGDDDINGGRGRDTINVGSGADVMSGGSDKDTFVFSDESDFGNVITDYQDGIDRLTATGYVASDLDIEASGANTIVSTDDWSVTFEGIDSTVITTDDFTFI